MKKLENKIVFVTGGNSGIGKAACLEAAREGATVVVADLAKSDHEQTIKDIIALGNQSLFVPIDVSDVNSVKAAIATTVEKFGRLDVAFNNAGIGATYSGIHDMPEEVWDKVIAINLTGQFLCSREAIKEFLRRGIIPERSKSAGKIICMSSVHEVIPWAGHANYSASKGGVMMLMKSIAQEYAPLKIRVNSIGPGAIRTPINHAAWQTPDAYTNLLKLIPAKRIGEVEDIGGAAVWLASDDSDYVNGITLFVDGGMLLYPGFEENG